MLSFRMKGFKFVKTQEQKHNVLVIFYYPEPLIFTILSVNDLFENNVNLERLFTCFNRLLSDPL